MNYFKKLLILLLLPATTAFGQTEYMLKLNLTGFKDGTSFKLFNLDKERIIDSGKLYNGKLTFKGHINEPVAGRIHTIDNKYLIVYLENKPISITGSYTDFRYASIKGSEINNYWTKSRDWQRNYQEERDSLISKFFTFKKADSVLSKQTLARVHQIDDAIIKYRLAFIQTEKPTYFTMQELFFLRNDLTRDTLKNLFKKFPQSLQNSKDGLVVKLYSNNAKPKIGSCLIDITGTTVNGNSYKLSDIKGKYVLLEFWASWCVPCRQENPALLKLYNQYKNKGFEIFGFSTDANKEDWVNAVSKDSLNWINVSDLKGSYSNGAASYQVRAIPQNFLIDPNGIIIAQNLRGDLLTEKLKLIFKD